MKPKIRAILEEADKDQLFEIIMSLSEKYKTLGEDIEFILDPKKIKNPQSYYNKLVKKTIDTNSWSKFPNKGVKGLEEMVDKFEFFIKIGNNLEAQKLCNAILAVIERCRKNYNSQNAEELLSIKNRLNIFGE